MKQKYWKKFQFSILYILGTKYCKKQNQKTNL